MHVEVFEKQVSFQMKGQIIYTGIIYVWLLHTLHQTLQCSPKTYLLVAEFSFFLNEKKL